MITRLSIYEFRQPETIDIIEYDDIPPGFPIPRVGEKIRNVSKYTDSEWTVVGVYYLFDKLGVSITVSCTRDTQE